MLHTWDGLHPSDSVKATVLIVGPNTPSQESLVKGLSKYRSSFELRIHTTNFLPLSKTSKRARTDYIVLMVDMSDASSLSNLKNNLTFIHLDYFFGRACIVAINYEDNSGLVFDPSELISITTTNQLTIFYASFDDNASVSHLVQRIISHLSIAICKNGASPLLLECYGSFLPTVDG